MALSILQLTIEQKEKFVTSLKKGLPIKTAARLAKIPAARVKFFLAQGEELSEDPYFDYDSASVVSKELYDFYMRSSEAVALAEQKWVGYVEEAAVDTWQAAMSLLRARNPDDWNESKKVEVKAEATVTSASINLDILSVQELEVLEAMLMKLSGDPQNKPLLIDSSPDKKVVG